METFSLYDLNEYLRRVVALNFSDPLWITCELSQCNDSRGNIYLDLIEKDETTGKTIAQSSGIIWYKTNLFLKNKLAELYNSILTRGTQVLLKVRVDFNEVYGMKLIVEDIDPSYTMGQMELQRQKTIEQLKSERLVHLNNLLPVPQVIQRVAVVSSQTAAGYADFMQQLRNNDYGYQYDLKLFNVAVQGQNMEREICKALMDIDREKDKYDIIAIIRGGGSKLDLAGFDSYEIAVRIARSNIPVITGIGHEIDDTIADLVSHTAVKTPTALASFLIDRNLVFESNLIDRFSNIVSIAKNSIEKEKGKVDLAAANIKLIPGNALFRRNAMLQHMEQSILTQSRQNLKRMLMKLDQAEKVLELSSPERLLEKGYTYLSKDGKIIRDPDSIKEGDTFEVITLKNKIKAEAKEVKSQS